MSRQKRSRDAVSGTECSVVSCGRPAGDMFMCEDCLATIKADLSELAGLGSARGLFTELAITSTRQNRFNASFEVTARAAERPLPFNSKGSQQASRLHEALARWTPEVVAMASPAREIPEQATGPTLAKILHAHALAIRLHPHAGMIFEEINGGVHRARRVIDRPQDRWYAGPCDECQADMYGRLTVGHPPRPIGELKCPACGKAYDIGTRRQELLDAIDDQLATSEELSAAFTVWGWALSPARIRKWVSRGKLTARTPHVHDKRQRPRYRVADVRELLIGETVK